MQKTSIATATIAFIVFNVQCFELLAAQENGRRLLEKVARTYGSLDSYQFEGTVSSHVRSAADKLDRNDSFFIAAVKPDKIRVAIKSSAMEMEYFSISSEKTIWEYLPRQGQYTQKESNEAYAGKELYFRMWAAALGIRLPTFERITAHLKRAEIVREEAIELNGSKNCYVIEAEFDSLDFGPGGGTSHKTLWIDKDQFAVLKEITTETIKLGALRGAEIEYITTFAVVKLNERLDDALFNFTPPSGARKVERLSDPQTTRTK